MPVRTDLKWGIRPLPDWVQEFREGQEETIESINDCYQSGAKAVFLEAPTGSGKSLIGECVRRLQRVRGVYCCSTKYLQDQFASDFPYGKVIKGRRNYLTASGPLDRFGRRNKSGESYITCADCMYTLGNSCCRWCQSRSACPYIFAREQAKIADLAILNTTYFLVGRRGFVRQFTVIDEADLLENELLNQVEVFISNRRMRKMEIDPPKRKTVSEAWPDWVEKEALPRVSKHFDTIRLDETPEGIKERNYLEELTKRLGMLAGKLRTGRWVYDGYKNGDVRFRPVEVDELGNELLWNQPGKFLFMSATILSADKMAEQLGMVDMETGKTLVPYEFVGMDSTFPKEHRPIYVVPVADMSFKLKDEEWPKMAQAVNAVVARHPNERILVHCVSYILANYLFEHASGMHKRPMFIYGNASEKGMAISDYKSSNSSVIFAASMDRGVDLPSDLCRVQIVAKIPFGDLKDKRVNMRMHMRGGVTWYKMEAIRTLIQMTGRGVRSKDDWCVTYILDKQFVSNIMASKYLFPRWWSKALRMDLSPRKLEG